MTHLREYRNSSRDEVKRALDNNEITHFRDPECGYEMELGKWYVLSDSGSCYTGEGFESFDAAAAWWNGEGRDMYELPSSVHVPLREPAWLGPEAGWYCAYSPQALRAFDILRYNLEQYFHELMEAQ